MPHISTRKIGVVCAFNPHNSGMYSVDLAARNFFTALGFDFDLIVTQSETSGATKSFGDLNFRVIRDQSLFRDYDLVVYWGDFLNSPAYGMRDFAKREVKLHGAESRDAGYEFWQTLMLGDPEGLTPCISVSNNLQGLPDNSADNPVVSTAYAERFSAFYPRDPLGLKKLRSFSPGASCFQGVDAAFLLDHSRAMIQRKSGPEKDILRPSLAEARSRKWASLFPGSNRKRACRRFTLTHGSS